MGSGSLQNNPVAETNWIAGPTFMILTAWTTSQDGGGLVNDERAAYDWSIGTFASFPGPGTHMGWLSLEFTHIGTKTVWNAGYPSRSNCPAGALQGNGSDCPNGTLEALPGAATFPQTWGELMYSFATKAGSTDVVVEGSTYPSWRSGVLDVTEGHSGGPLFLWWTDGCTAGCIPGWYVFGAAASVNLSYNRFNRLTAGHGSYL